MILWGFLGRVNSTSFLGVSSGRLLEKGIVDFKKAQVPNFIFCNFTSKIRSKSREIERRKGNRMRGPIVFSQYLQNLNCQLFLKSWQCYAHVSGQLHTEAIIYYVKLHLNKLNSLKKSTKMERMSCVVSKNK